MNFRLIGSGLAALALLATSHAAQGADIPRPVYKGARSVVAYYNWTGLYAGINGGYGWGTSHWDAPVASPKPAGWLIGGTVGYNYQAGSLLWGVEGDFDWSDAKDTVACVGFFCTTKNEWLATVRGRLGYALDRWLPYITAGGVYGRIKASSTNPAALGASSNEFGWTAGAGIEYGFAGSWSAKLEYLYVDLGSFNCGAACAPATANVSFREHLIRAGLNYRFSAPVFSAY